MTKAKPISRRAALARLGLGAASVYMSPAMLGLSKAHAASSASAPSPASPASPPSPPSKASPPSPASPPSAPSAVSSPSGPSRPASSTGNTSPSGPSGPGSCRQTSLPDGAQITRRDYERAQQAISRGDAQPLRKVLDNVQSRHPGRLLRVGFSRNGRTPSFRVVIVNRSGAIVSVTVDAGSGQITNVQNC
jgi:hypothetical protein